MQANNMSEIIAFTADHVARLTGLSPRQLRYWDETEFFAPTFLDEYRRRTFGRIYSFRDLVGLRTIAILRNEHRVPLQELRRVGQWLLREHESPWSSLQFVLAGRRVLFIDPGTGVAAEASGAGQASMTIALEPIASDMRRAANRLKQRSKDQIAHVVAGTRIPTTAIWNFHSAGYDSAAIIREYPSLTADDVRAAIEFEVERGNAA